MLAGKAKHKAIALPAIFSLQPHLFVYLFWGGGCGEYGPMVGVGSSEQM